MKAEIIFQTLKTDEDLISQDWSGLHVTALGHSRNLKSDTSDVMFGNNVKLYTSFLFEVVQLFKDDQINY